MWWIKDSEEAISEEVVEADHPVSWMELPRRYYSKWNKVELIPYCFISFIKQYIFNIIVKKLLDVDAVSDRMKSR